MCEIAGKIFTGCFGLFVVWFIYRTTANDWAASRMKSGTTGEILFLDYIKIELCYRYDDAPC